MSRYSVISEGWKPAIKTVGRMMCLLCVFFMFSSPVSALQTALVRTNNGDVYQIRFRNQKNLPEHVFRDDFSIYDAAGEVKICLDWYKKEQPAGQHWRPIAAELWTAARILAKTPRRSRVFSTSSLANSLNEAATELMPTVGGLAEQRLVGQVVSQVTSHTPLKTLNIVPKSGPIALIVMPAEFLAKLGGIEIRMRRLLYAFWLASGYADSAIQLQRHANQRAERLWDAIDAGEIIDIFGGDLNLDGRSGEVRGGMSIDGPLRLRLVAKVYQDTAEKAAELGIDLGKSEKSWMGWLAGLSGVGNILELLSEAGGALSTKKALEQLYDSIGQKIKWSLSRNIEDIYDLSYYKGGFCEPGVVVRRWSTNRVVEGSGFAYTVVLNTRPDRNVTVVASSNNPDVTVLPASLTFTPNNWYEPKTFTVRTVADTDGVNDRASINHIVRGYGNIISASGVFVVVIEGAPRLTEKFPNQTLTMGVSSEPLDLSEYFRDPDGDPLTYTVWPEDRTVVRIARTRTGSRITIEPQRIGSTRVTVEARDPRGLTAWHIFTVTVQERQAAAIPDLVVESLSPSKSTLVPGERFTLSATVRNRGTARSQSGVLRYYENLSEAGNRNVRRLVPDQTSDMSIQLEAPEEPGVYYYDACVSKVRDEVNKDNNCSTRIAITVGIPVNRVPVVNRAPVTVGGIPDQTLAANGSRVRLDLSNYFRDGDGDPLTYTTTSDNPNVAFLQVLGTQVSILPLTTVGRANVRVTASDGSLRVTQSFTVIVQRTQPVNRPPVAIETIASQTLTVNGAARQGDISKYFRDPDGNNLTYTARSADTNVVRVSMSRAYLTLTPVRAGSATVTITASDGSSIATQHFTVRVQSKQPTQPVNRPPAAIETIAPQTLTVNGAARQGDISKYFRDPDGDRLTYTARSDNTNVATVSVSGSEVTITPQRAGNTTLHVTASDGVSDATQSVSVTVASAPSVQDPASFDLAIQSVTVSKDTLVPGESFTLSITIHNNGPGTSGAASLSYYYSFIQGRTPEDQIHREGTVALASLASGANTTKSFRLNAPSTPKTYYYGAWLSGSTDDTNLYNDVATEVGVTVRTAQPLRVPDLSIQSIRVNDDTLEPGESFKFYATVVNRGKGPAHRSTTLRYYRSTDAHISTNDTEVDTDSVNPLNLNEKTEVWDSLRVPNSPGTYYYGVCVDSVDGESNTRNNCSTAIAITVRASDPDLVVESVRSSDTTVEVGDRFTFYATVRNRGSGEARRTTLRYYRSSDSTISDRDTEEDDTDSVSSLDASETSNEQVTLTAPNRSGVYYYGACVDSVTDESDTRNNCSTAIRVTVSDAIIVRPPPGLRVGDSIVVQNASGGGLNGLIVRAGPGTGFLWVISAFNGATGTIMDGPQHANGFKWWKVRWNHSDQVFCDVNPCVGWVFEFFRGTRVIAEEGLAAPTLNVKTPTETVLLSNYPNPFNPETWIPYQLSKPTDVTVSIYSVDGKLVRTLALGHQPAGVYQSKSRAAYWDGRNAFGERVASGLYFYTLTAGDFAATRKMLIRK